VSAARIQHAIPLTPGEVEVWLLLIRAELRAGVPETLTLPLAFVPDDALGGLAIPVAEAGFARVSAPVPGVLCDALAVPACCRAVLRAILVGQTRASAAGEFISTPVVPTPPEVIEHLDNLPVAVYRSNRKTLAVVYGEDYILKTFRRVEEGMNPALELGRALAERNGYAGAAPVIGSIEFRPRGAEPATLGVLYRYVHNQGTGWQYTIDELSRYFERVAALSRESPPRPPARPPLIGPDPTEPPAEWSDLAGGFLESARLLGRRTAEMHLALAADRGSKAFAPEPFGKLYQRSVYQSMRNMTGRLCRHLEHAARSLPEPARELAGRLLATEGALLKRFRAVTAPTIGGYRIRAHGDYHLARLLYTGKDFVVIGFEGDLGRTVEDRRVKRSPLRDVASMIRSFDYAVRSTLLGLTLRRGRAQGVVRDEDIPVIEPWAEAWYHRVAREYVTAYIELMEPSGLLPPGEADRREVLELFLLEKALQETEAELVARSDRVAIPLLGVIRLLGEPPAGA
jgi:maltose alpha-D-glucosyltransferase/alpha-amylase